MKFSAFIFVSIPLILCPLVATAQISGILGDSLNVEMIPENPRPNEVVNVNLTDFSINLNSSKIIWRVNGVVKKSGTGEKSFVFNTGEMNTITTLSITVETIDGEVSERTLKIRPSMLDLIWQSEAYTPPFYKGRSLFSYQNKITFIAVPHITGSNGAEISSKNLLYKWRLNGNVVDDVSGFGKNTYTLTGSLIARPLDITVEVSSLDETSKSIARTTIEPTEPSIVFYKKDPLYGIVFEKALTESVELESQEISVVGVPFYFGTLSLPSPYLSFKWKINGVPVENDPTQSNIVLRQNGGIRGVSNISLEIENSDKILQISSKSFNLEFGQNNP